MATPRMTNARTLRVVALMAGLILVAVGIDIVKRGASRFHAIIIPAALAVGRWMQVRKRKGGGDAPA